MIKKVLIIIVVLIATYFIVAGVLTISGICPKYIDLMPKVKVIEPDFRGAVWYIFCPFSGKVY